MPVTEPKLKVGERVHVHGDERKGRIVELRGPLGPGGIQIYRVILRSKPPAYVEVREDQLEPIAPVNGANDKQPGAAG